MPKTRDKLTTHQVVPKVVVAPDTPAYYVNFIQVSNTQYDFSLSFARMGSPLSEDQFERIKKGEPLPLDAILQVIMPPTVAEGLITALTTQQQKYKDLLAQQKPKEGGQSERIARKRKQSNRLQ